MLGISLLAFGIWKLFLDNGPAGPETTTVPSLQGLDQVAAAAELEAAQLLMNNMGTEPSDTVLRKPVSVALLRQALQATPQAAQRT